MKLVHEVKMEVYSRDEARHTEKSDFQRRGGRWTSKRDLELQFDDMLLEDSYTSLMYTQKHRQNLPTITYTD